MLFLDVAVPIETFYDVLAPFYSHQHPQYTLVDISACCAVRIATLGDVTTAWPSLVLPYHVALGDICGVNWLIFNALMHQELHGSSLS